MNIAGSIIDYIEQFFHVIRTAEGTIVNEAVIPILIAFAIYIFLSIKFHYSKIWVTILLYIIVI